MFALTQSMNYYLCSQPIDMRKGIYSLYNLVKHTMHHNPLSGEVYLFVGARKKTIKILHWEQGGFVLYQKKLEQGTFELPVYQGTQAATELQWRQFILMIEGISLQSAKYNKRFPIYNNI